jgi:peroxiredoxin
VELQGRVDELKRQGLGVAAVSYDSVAVLSDFSNRRGITFPLLSDRGSITIKKYGVLNTTVPETSKQTYGIPFPGTFMLSDRGIVTSRFFEQAYQERSTVGSVMARLETISAFRRRPSHRPNSRSRRTRRTGRWLRGLNSLWCWTFAPLAAFTYTRQA